MVQISGSMCYLKQWLCHLGVDVISHPITLILLQILPPLQQLQILQREDGAPARQSLLEGVPRLLKAAHVPGSLHRLRVHVHPRPGLDPRHHLRPCRALLQLGHLREGELNGLHLLQILGTPLVGSHQVAVNGDWGKRFICLD